MGSKISDADTQVIHDRALVKFKLSQRGVRGQQITIYDSPTWWIIKETELFLEEQNKKESNFGSDWVDDGV